MRLDKFLKVSRLIKQRSTANDACGLGRVSVNGKPAKPSKEVSAGDTLSVRFGERTVCVRIKEIKDSTKKEDAASMYEVIGENDV